MSGQGNDGAKRGIWAVLTRAGKQAAPPAPAVEATPPPQDAAPLFKSLFGALPVAPAETESHLSLILEPGAPAPDLPEKVQPPAGAIPASPVPPVQLETHPPAPSPSPPGQPDRAIGKILTAALLPPVARPLSDLGRPVLPVAAPGKPQDVETQLQAWAMREVAPWRLHPVTREQAQEKFAELNDRLRAITLFKFDDGVVTTVPKPEAVRQEGGYAFRTESYLAYFREVAIMLPRGFATKICMTMDDVLHEKGDVPLFSFQMKRGARSLLVPDIDFMINQFYEDPSWIDPYRYMDKQATAMFAGSTTGGWINASVARNLSLPRLRAAGFFVGNPRVDFRLPGIGQITEPEAQVILEAQPFCQKPRLPWAEQLRSRFIISIDGNGATCSRVVVGLRSNSVLMKYDSEYVLYYFGGLQPWLQYIPIAEDADVEKILDLEATNPDRFRKIAVSGAAFASSYLTKSATQQYTAMLLQFYENSFAGVRTGG